jgi:hypothetical protein
MKSKHFKIIYIVAGVIGAITGFFLNRSIICSGGG